MVEYFDNVQDRFSDYLTDESAIVKNGYADRIYFPINTDEVCQILSEASEIKIPVTISGGGTGISGGRVPLRGWIIATDKMTQIDTYQELWTDPETKIEYGLSLKQINSKHALLTVPVSMTIKAVQNYTREKGWFYPPDPTERSAFIGGTVNTNASGARTFKFGPTRDWIEAISVVLINGSILHLQRSENNGEITSDTIKIKINRKSLTIHRPRYQLPIVRKNVAGPVIHDNSHVIDLFIGSGGLFGVTTEVTVKLIKPPKEIVSIFVFCPQMDQAYKIIKQCQANRESSLFPVPMAVEFLGERPINIMRTADSTIALDMKGLIILEQDAVSSEQMEEAISYWIDLFEKLGIEDTRVAQTYSEIEEFKKLRHMVPETVNSIVKQHGQSKIGTDCAVPEKYLVEYFEMAFTIGRQFEKYQNNRQNLDEKPGYALWAHGGDTHIHLNLIPRTDEESTIAKEMVIELIHRTVELGGSIAAEHGLGKKMFGGDPALYYQYGQEGLEEIRKMKLDIDPDNLLNRGNIIG